MKFFKVLLTVLVSLLLLTACDAIEMVSRFADRDLEEETVLTDAVPVQTEPQYDPQDFYVNVDSILYIRSGPGTEYAKIGSLARGQTITVLYFENGWGYTGTGWISKDFLLPIDTSAAGLVISEYTDYRIVRADRTYYNDAGQGVIYHYFDYPILTGSSAGLHKINAQIRHMADDFLWSEETMENHARDKKYNPNYPWSYIKSAEVSFPNNQTVQIIVYTYWYMGGETTNTTEYYTFDLQTGEPI